MLIVVLGRRCGCGVFRKTVQYSTVGLSLSQRLRAHFPHAPRPGVLDPLKLCLYVYCKDFAAVLTLELESTAWFPMGREFPRSLVFRLS